MNFTTEVIIRALSQVPEVKLKLFDLAWEVVVDGEFDTEKLLLNRMELMEASKEAETYMKETRQAVWALKNIAPF